MQHIVFEKCNEQMALAFTCDPKKSLFIQTIILCQNTQIVNMGNIHSKDGKCKRHKKNMKSKPEYNSALYDKFLLKQKSELQKLKTTE